MTNVPLFVGVDYHQDRLQICVVDAAAHVRVNRTHPNDPAAVAALLAGLGGDVRAVGIEACCGAADFAEDLLLARSSGGGGGGVGYRVELAHPGYVARLKQSPDKTDFSDARLLADLTRVGYLPRVWLPPAAVRDQRRAAKLRVGGILREQRVKLDGTRWGKPWVAQARDNGRLSEQARWIVNDLLDEIEHLTGKVRAVEGRLRAATDGDAVVERLRTTIEGVGEVTAWMMAAWIGRFDRFGNGKQLARYCGLSPRNASSGNRRADAGLVDAANRQLRAVLIQAAHRLCRTDARWGALADRLLKDGKPKCVVVAAVANRWVRSMHHRMLDAAAAAAAAAGGADE